MLFPISHGPREERLGWAADFCPVCRKVTAFAVDRVEKAPRVYFGAAGDGVLQGHSQTCSGCHIGFAYQPARFARLTVDEGETIAHLALATFPTILEKYAGRLAIEKRIAADPHALEAALRQEMLAEPFALASVLFEDNEDDTGIRLIATALRPLDPSEVEVDECLTHYREGGARIGRASAVAILKEIKYDSSAHDFDY